MAFDIRTLLVVVDAAFAAASISIITNARPQEALLGLFK